MPDFFAKLFSSDFLPHGHCYFWQAEIVWLHVISDALIALAYYCIPFALWYFIRHRKDLAFNWIFGCFAAFIFACGTTHLFQIRTLWHATYRLEGLVKAITAGLSIATALVLIPLIPKALRLPTRKDLEDQIAERERAEEEARELNAELERRVEARTADLKRSNEELAQFAYVASHDLQEPLRMVSIYTQMLKHRYGAQLDGDADQYIQFAVGGAKRMQSLIGDLLSFAQVDQARPNRALMSADEALDLALLALKIPIAESGARITRQPLPRVIGDKSQLALVFQNLIANSLKYCGDQVPEIRVAVEGTTQHWQISVRDNGIGFDQTYAERIFGVFKRLHTNADYPGTGIGLSIAQKIVVRGGGRIWAESKSGAGATFFFTIPKVETSAYTADVQ
jgi:signal transduction histidine kinase